jgi:FtsP/CotA-like multicopper oxidase with cupredoxin domain
MRVHLSVGLALSALLMSGDSLDRLWATLCTTHPSVARHPVAPRVRANLLSAAYAQPSQPCAPPPTSYQPLQQVTGTGNLEVAMAVRQGTGLGGSSSLCFTHDGVTNPVIRVQQGVQLAIPLTNAIANDDSTGTVNCAVQTFVDGGECAQPEAGFQARPGQDGPYYPIEAAVPVIADGTANLHTHGFATSPLPCHDEVIFSALYPVNWGGSTNSLYECQNSPSELNYTFDIPDNHPAGVYWYHTHRHGQEQAQQMMGASGPIVITGDQDEMRAARGVTDEVLMVRDVPARLVPGPISAVMPRRRQLARAMSHHTAPIAADDVSIDPRIDRANEIACLSDDPDTGGPPITRLTLNGALVPEAANGLPPDGQLLTKTMQSIDRQVWRIVNGSAQTTLSPQLVLASGGSTTVLPMTVIARDGVPLHDDDGTQRYEVRDTTKHPLLVPTAGRVEILVAAPPPGATLYLDTRQVAGGCASDGQPARRLLRVVSTGEGVAPDNADVQPTGRETLFTNLLSTPPTVRRVLAFTEYPRSFTTQTSGWVGATPDAGDFDPDATDFFLNLIASSDGEANAVTIHPFPMSGPPDIVVHLNGQERVTEEWLVQNYTLESHAFHIHQTHFRDITRGADDTSPVLDTVLVPPATRAPSPQPGMDMPDVPGFVRLRLTFTKSDVGTFVVHCHIGEHVDNGMMQKITVLE